jgi:hypothetical protein
MKKIAAGFMTLLILGGCARPVAYRPYDAGYIYSGGYSDTKIQEGIYRISFEGNSFTTSSRAADLAILRSAEVALRDGYRYFTISDNKSDTVSDLSSAGYRRVALDYFPVSVYVIQCYKEKPAQASGIVYDAGEVTKNIRAQYKIK